MRRNVVVAVAVSVARIARAAQITAQNVGSTVDIMNDSGYLLCLGLFFRLFELPIGGQTEGDRAARIVPLLQYGSQTLMLAHSLKLIISSLLD